MPNELLLLLVLAIIVVVSKLAGHASRLIGQPVVFGEILAGLILGPSLLNMLGWSFFAPTPESAHWLDEQVRLLAHVGVLLLMFVAGLETDLAQIRSVGKTALAAALMGVFVPLGAGTILGIAFGLDPFSAVFIGTVLTATSVSISAQTLMELGQLRTREGATILGAAVIDDVLGIIVLSFVIAFAPVSAGAGAAAHTTLPEMLAALTASHLGWTAQVSLLKVAFVILLMASFFAMALWVAARFSKLLALADRLHASHVVPAAALALVFLFAVGAEYFGQVAAITGAYIVGVFLGRTRYCKEIEHAVHPFTYALFVPVFLMSIGLGTDARVLGSSLEFTGLLVLLAILTKILGCGIGARFSGFSNRESLRVGVGMISRGEVGLIVAGVGLSRGVIDKAVYATLVIMVLATTVLTPVLLRLVFPQGKAIEEDALESVATLEEQDEEEFV